MVIELREMGPLCDLIAFSDGIRHPSKYFCKTKDLNYKLQGHWENMCFYTSDVDAQVSLNFKSSKCLAIISKVVKNAVILFEEGLYGKAISCQCFICCIVFAGL